MKDGTHGANIFCPNRVAASIHHGDDSIMIRTEILTQLGRQRLLIAPVRSEIDGVWRIKISTDDGRAVFLDTTAASQLADQLRSNGERLLATRLEIGIEQRRRCAVLEKAA